MNAANDDIQVVLASDENFAQHLAVTMVSLLTNTSRLPVCFHILHNGLCEETMVRIRAVTEIRPAEINFIELNSADFAGYPLASRLSVMTYARLKVPSLLPDLTRVLYMDCDMIVRNDLTDLWQIDLEGHPVGACLDFVSAHKIKKLKVAPSDYFNAGLLLMNLKKLREMGFEQRCLDEFNREERVFKSDQDLLNMIFAGDWKRIHNRWNTFCDVSFGKLSGKKIYDISPFREAVADPAIIHYTGVKPWSYFFRGRFGGDYWFFLDKTEYRGFRYPSPTFKDFVAKYMPGTVKKTVNSLRKRLK